MYNHEKCLSSAKTQTAIDDYIVNARSKNPENYKHLSEIRFEPDQEMTLRTFGLAIEFLK